MAKRVAKSIPADAPAPERAPLHTVTTLDGVIGQAQAKKVLGAAMISSRVHHAWIFYGPQGVGKYTTAVAFAATLLDPTTHPGRDETMKPEAGGQVQSLVKTGNHPDLHIISKELAAISEDAKLRDAKQITLPIGVVREFLIQPALQTRVMNHSASTRAGKVFIVDEAELMAAPAQNGVLKLLEEPPEGTVLILLTSSEDRLLATIRSRCQRVAFSPLSKAEMERWFETQASGPKLTASQHDWVLRFAAGSPGAAALAVEHGLFAWHQTLGPLLDEVVHGQFPPELPAALAKLVSERAEAAVKASPGASKDAANKVWARRLLGYIAEDVRLRLRVLAEKSGGDGVMRENPTAARLLHMLDCVSDAERNLGSNVNLAFVFENLVAQSAAQVAPV